MFIQPGLRREEAATCAWGRRAGAEVDRGSGNDVDAERPGGRSHAERGNESKDLGDPAGVEAGALGGIRCADEAVAGDASPLLVGRLVRWW